MFLDTTAFNLQGAGTNIRLDPVPDVCPRCHRSVHPKETYIALLAERALCQAIYRCTHQSCQEAFVATYKAGGSAGGRPVFVLANTAPIAPRPTAFPSDVATLSPTFVDIHGQVDSAEAAHLSQLVGIGLRKALEFLVKDYAIYKNPSHVDAIRKAPLAKCIADYIDDSNVKACAQRAVWLGNDETHYTRKWEDKDISDLKVLVRLTVNWIENGLLTEKYMKDMSDGKR